jgi:endogenous inhibitor of DNA gyrase (YacG/DUF329 family)
MAETRRCGRCGREFEPKREHARFCSARCRVAWNRENWNQVTRDQQKWGSENWADASGPQDTGTSALRWAFTAMHDTTRRLGRARASDRGQAFAVIGEAVWWVTIVDATLVRHYPDDYDAALDGLADAERQTTETTFAGLRFVRNRMGYHADHADFIQPCADDAAGGDAPITEWTWRSLPEPAVATLPPRGQEWELSRYQAYQDVLAGQRVGVTFGRTSDFHDLVVRTVRSPDAAAGAGDQAAETSGERRAPRRVT